MDTRTLTGLLAVGAAASCLGSCAGGGEPAELALGRGVDEGAVSDAVVLRAWAEGPRVVWVSWEAPAAQRQDRVVLVGVDISPRPLERLGANMSWDWFRNVIVEGRKSGQAMWADLPATRWRARYYRHEPDGSWTLAMKSGIVNLAEGVEESPSLSAWECDPSRFDAVDGCDCACGAPDPDCEYLDAEVIGCEPGETCSADGLCQGGSDP